MWTKIDKRKWICRWNVYDLNDILLSTSAYKIYNTYTINMNRSKWINITLMLLILLLKDFSFDAKSILHRARQCTIWIFSAILLTCAPFFFFFFFKVPIQIIKSTHASAQPLPSLPFFSTLDYRTPGRYKARSLAVDDLSRALSDDLHTRALELDSARGSFEHNERHCDGRWMADLVIWRLSGFLEGCYFF